MSNERNYTPYINKNGILEILPKGQSSFDDLAIELKSESAHAEPKNGYLHPKIGAVAMGKKTTE